MVVEEKAKAEAGSGDGWRRTLRPKGGERREDVRTMQDSLEKLGYYSSEEDMDFPSFSTGTERAVKTWQATVGTSEDGVMTSELLVVLFAGHIGEDVKTKDGINGAVVPAVT